MNELLDPFWVFTCLGILMSGITAFSGVTLYIFRDDWKKNDLVKYIIRFFGMYSVGTVVFFVFNKEADIKYLGAYPYLKIVGAILFMAVFSGVTRFAAKVKKEVGIEENI